MMAIMSPAWARRAPPRWAVALAAALLTLDRALPMCPAGQGCAAGGNCAVSAVDCVDCVAGHNFSAAEGPAPCDPLPGCPVGQGGEQAPSPLRNTSCVACTAMATFSDVLDASECAPIRRCPAGEGKSGGGTEGADVVCSACPVGKFSGELTSAPCEDCAANMEATEEGLSACVCMAGFEGADCTACPSGYYKEQSGAASCDACPAGTVQRFRYFAASGISWDAADAACVELGGALASIHSAIEQEEAAGMLPGDEVDAWIGLTDTVAEGSWAWSDGTTYDFGQEDGTEGFLPGEPNGGDDHDHVRTRRAGWRDQGGGWSGIEGFICRDAGAAASLDDCLCPAGSAGLAGTGCTPCPAGQYKRAAGRAAVSAGMSGCATCAPGMVTDTLAEAGASSCAACDEGQYSEYSHIACTSCAPLVSENHLDYEVGMVESTQCPCPAGRHLRRLPGPTETLYKDVASAAGGGIRNLKRFAHPTTPARTPTPMFPVAVEQSGFDLQMAQDEEAVFPLDSREPWDSEGVDTATGLPVHRRLPGDEQFPRYRCEKCEEGRFSVGGMETHNLVAEDSGCTECPANTVTFADGATSQDDCRCIAMGFEMVGGECTQCAEGRYKSVVGEYSCTECPGVSSWSGSTLFANLGLPDTPSICRCGLAGYEGSITAADGTAFDTVTETATYRATADYFRDGYATGGCTACPAGKYAADGEESCTECPANSGTLEEAKISAFECGCDRGFREAGRTDGVVTCEKCPLGQYTTQHRVVGQPTTCEAQCDPHPYDEVCPALVANGTACSNDPRCVFVESCTLDSDCTSVDLNGEEATCTDLPGCNYTAAVEATEAVAEACTPEPDACAAAHLDGTESSCTAAGACSYTPAVDAVPETAATCTTTAVPACAGANGDQDTCQNAGSCAFTDVGSTTAAQDATCTTTPVPSCTGANADQNTCENAGSCTWSAADSSCAVTDQDDTACTAAADQTACESAGVASGDCTWSPPVAADPATAICEVIDQDATACTAAADQTACESAGVASGDCTWSPAVDAAEAVVEGCAATNPPACESVQLNGVAATCTDVAGCQHTPAVVGTSAVEEACTLVEDQCQAIELDRLESTCTDVAGCSYTSSCAQDPNLVVADIAAWAGCEICPAGQQEQAGGGSCEACEAGRYKELNGPETCVLCPTGQHTAAGGATAESDCQCGAGFGLVGSACQACASGSYKAAVGDTACDACPAHSTPSNQGAVAVTSCLCEPGYAFAEATSTCDACPEGRYKSSAGAEPCDECSEGHYTASESEFVSTTRTACSPSSSSPCTNGEADNRPPASTAATHCEPCGVRWKTRFTGLSLLTSERTARANNDRLIESLAVYQIEPSVEDFYGNVTCSACPTASTIGNAVGGTTAEACSRCAPGSSGVPPDDCSACAAGQYANASGCFECPVGRYRGASFEGQCSVCPAGSTTPQPGAATVEECICLPGYAKLEWTESKSSSSSVSRTYRLNRDVWRCVPCGPGRYADGSACTFCPLGKYSKGWLAACTDCPDHATTAYIRDDSTTMTSWTFMSRDGPTSALLAADPQPPWFVRRRNYEGSPSPDTDPVKGALAAGVASCFCEPGYAGALIRDGDTCTECGVGEYGVTGRALRHYSSQPVSPWLGSTLPSCSLCPQGMYKDAAGSPPPALALAPAGQKTCDQGEGVSREACAQAIESLAGSEDRLDASIDAEFRTDALLTVEGNVNTQPSGNRPSGCSARKNRNSDTNQIENFQAFFNPSTVPASANTDNFHFACTTDAVPEMSDQGVAFSPQLLSSWGQCRPCPPNTVAQEGATGLAECVCKPGTRGLLDPDDPQFFTLMEDRRIGQTGYVAAPTCMACPAGQHAFSPGSTNCTECPVGRYSLPPRPPEVDPVWGDLLQDMPYVQMIAAELVGQVAGVVTYDVGLGNCTACPDHSTTGWNITGATSYTACMCEPGYTGVINGPTEQCTPCTIGRFSRGGAQSNGQPNQCERCPDGRYSSAITQAECLGRCPAGTGSEAGSTNSSQCLECPVGRVSDHGGGCQFCPAGTIANGEVPRLFSTCDTCELGKYSLSGDGNCTSCQPGRADMDQDPVTECTDCPRGKSMNATGAVDCWLCDVGQEAKPGSTACSLCAAGKYDHDNDAQTYCLKCAKSYYSDQPGLSSCTPCPEGFFSDQYALKSVEECIPCPPGQWSYPAAMSCYPCEVGTFRHDTHGCQSCTDVEGLICPVTGMIRPWVLPGYYMPDGQLSPIMCTPKEACLSYDKVTLTKGKGGNSIVYNPKAETEQTPFNKTMLEAGDAKVTDATVRPAVKGALDCAKEDSPGCRPSCFKGREDFWLVTPPGTIQETEAWCMQRGGHLASIHDDDELRSLTEYIADKTQAKFPWLGGYDCTTQLVAQASELCSVAADERLHQHYDLAIHEDVKAIGECCSLCQHAEGCGAWSFSQQLSICELKRWDEEAVPPSDTDSRVDLNGVPAPFPKSSAWTRATCLAVPGSCAGSCSDELAMTEAECLALGQCSESVATSQIACETLGSCSNPAADDEAACDELVPPGIWTSAGATWTSAGAVWTAASTPEERASLRLDFGDAVTGSIAFKNITEDSDWQTGAKFLTFDQHEGVSNEELTCTWNDGTPWDLRQVQYYVPADTNLNEQDCAPTVGDQRGDPEQSLKCGDKLHFYSCDPSRVEPAGDGPPGAYCPAQTWPDGSVTYWAGIGNRWLDWCSSLPEVRKSPDVQAAYDAYCRQRGICRIDGGGLEANDFAKLSSVRPVQSSVTVAPANLLYTFPNQTAVPTELDSPQLVSSPRCSIGFGRGVGGTHEFVGFADTPRACVDLVLVLAPGASGLTFSVSLGDCVADFDVSQRDDDPAWVSCRLMTSRPVAMGGAATQSGTPEGAENAHAGLAVDGLVDGILSRGSCAQVGLGASAMLGLWWQLDLGATVLVDRVEVYHRTDGRLDDLQGASVVLAQSGGPTMDAEGDVYRCGYIGAPGKGQMPLDRVVQTINIVWTPTESDGCLAMSPTLQGEWRAATGDVSPVFRRGSLQLAFGECAARLPQMLS